jgi:hypothetical protein
VFHPKHFHFRFDGGHQHKLGFGRVLRHVWLIVGSAEYWSDGSGSCGLICVGCLGFGGAVAVGLCGARGRNFFS